MNVTLLNTIFLISGRVLQTIDNSFTDCSALHLHSLHFDMNKSVEGKGTINKFGRWSTSENNGKAENCGQSEATFQRRFEFSSRNVLVARCPINHELNTENFFKNWQSHGPRTRLYTKKCDQNLKFKLSVEL